MDNIIIISQNVKLPSLSKIRHYIKTDGNTLLVSTQLIFANEREIITKALGTKTEFVDFSELLNDAEREACDKDAFCPERQNRVSDYFIRIKQLKNQRIVEKLLSKFNASHKILVCNDLGIDETVWIENGFTKVDCEYYYSADSQKRSFARRVLGKIYRKMRLPNKPIYEAYKDGQRYLFYGSMYRIQYRLDLAFRPASWIERVKLALLKKGIVFDKQTIRLSTLHEGAGLIPDLPEMNFKMIQDGFLPENYSSCYLHFFGHKYVEYYAWDTLGRKTFIYHHLKNRIIPFRKKLYLPEPRYPEQVKKVLCVASGAGDWTAIKNRSDEDKMLVAFGEVAKKYPQIEFIYRCHPVWVHPSHQGVNSINRAASYIQWLNLPNFKISSNIPNAIENGKFILSYKRSSFEEDLKDVDIVFGEHSISMIDAAFNNILFGSVNVTGHRDFFIGITKLGFPHCESVEDIELLLKNVSTSEFKDGYEKAILNYNKMTDEEGQ